MTKEQLLFCLLRAEIADKEIAFTADDITAALAEDVLCLAQHHSIAHLAAHALKANGLLPEQSLAELCDQYTFTAASDDTRLHYELDRIRDVLVQEGIPFIPLKGAVLQHLYPESWMRNSCDIDVLVKQTDLEDAIHLLSDRLQYTVSSRSAHDVSLLLGSTHVELHFDLMEEGRVKHSCEILKNVWSLAQPVEDTCEYEMPDALFYLYHIAHMAKHMKTAGCGVRSFVDVWVLNHMATPDRESRQAMLEASGLLTFADTAERLSEVWLSGAEHTPVTQELESFVLQSGTYGSNTNRVAITRAKTGSKARYCLSRIFLPYASMRLSYPVLQRYPVLLPLYWVIRWFRILFSGSGRTNLKDEVNVNVTHRYGSVARVCQLIEDLEL